MDRSRLALAATAVISAFGACVATWPLVGNLTDATLRSGDTWLSAWQLNWYQHALLHDPAGWANANIFFPYDNAGATNDLLWTHALLTLPAAAFDSPVLAHNLAFLLGIVLCGVCAHLLIAELTDAPWAAAVGAVLFALTPFRFLHIGHLSVAAFWSVPLLFWALLRCLRHPSWARAVGVAACGVATALSSLYNPVYVAPLLPLVVLLGARRSSRSRGAWLPLCTTGVAGLLLLVPFVAPFVAALRQFGVAAAPGDLARYAADLSSLGQRPLYLGGAAADGAINPEALLYPGAALLALPLLAVALGLLVAAKAGGTERRIAVAVVLAATAIVLGSFLAPSGSWGRTVWRLVVLAVVWGAPAALAASAFMGMSAARPRGAGVALRFGIAGAAISFALALGPEAYYLSERIGPAPYSLLAAATRVFEGTRAPARFGSLVVLFLAITASAALLLLQAAITQLRRRRASLVTEGRRLDMAGAVAAAIGVLAIGAAFAELPADHDLIPVPDFDAPVYAWLAAQPDDFGVLELPEHRAWRALRYMLASKRHQKHLVNGAGRITPMLWQQFVDLEAWTPEFFTFVASYFPVRYVIVHENGLPPVTRIDGVWREAAAAAGWSEEEAIADAHVFRVDRSSAAGTFVDRIYLRRDLAPAARVSFAARSTAAAPTELTFFQNAEPVDSWPIDGRWRTFEVEISVAAAAPLVEDPWPRAATLLTWQSPATPPGSFELRDIIVTALERRP